MLTVKAVLSLHRICQLPTEHFRQNCVKTVSTNNIYDVPSRQQCNAHNTHAELPLHCVTQIHRKLVHRCPACVYKYCTLKTKVVRAMRLATSTLITV